VAPPARIPADTSEHGGPCKKKLNKFIIFTVPQTAVRQEINNQYAMQMMKLLRNTIVDTMEADTAKDGVEQLPCICGMSQLYSCIEGNFLLSFYRGPKEIIW
jgi:hypothetical protein